MVPTWSRGFPFAAELIHLVVVVAAAAAAAAPATAASFADSKTSVSILD